MSDLSDFQAICDEWGRAFSSRYGTTCRWVKLHAEGWGMEQYQQYKIAVRSENMRYGTQSPIDVPGIATKQEFVNHGSIQQSTTLTFKKSTESSFTWSLTEGLKAGIEVSAEVTVPAVAKVGTKISTELSFSATQSKTEKETREWTVTQPVIAQPYTKVDAIMTIAEKKYDIDYEADLVISGWVALWNENKINLGNGDHWLYFFPVTYVIQENPKPGYAIRGNDVVFTARGQFTGVQGVGTSTVLNEYPLDHETGAVASQKPIQYAVAPGSASDSLRNPVFGYISDERGANPQD